MQNSLRYSIIHINDLQVDCVLGCNDAERENPQKILINIDFSYDVSAPAESDEITNAISYLDVVNLVEEIVKRDEYKLLERLASTCSDHIFEKWPQIGELNLRIEKFGNIPNAKGSAITISTARIPDQTEDLISSD